MVVDVFNFFAKEEKSEWGEDARGGAFLKKSNLWAAQVVQLVCWVGPFTSLVFAIRQRRDEQLECSPSILREKRKEPACSGIARQLAAWDTRILSRERARKTGSLAFTLWMAGTIRVCKILFESFKALSSSSRRNKGDRMI